MTTLILNLCVGYVEQSGCVFVWFVYFYFIFGLALIVLFCSIFKTVVVYLDLYVLKNLNEIVYIKKKIKTL